MSFWDDYPETYRQDEVGKIIKATKGGSCVSLVGLSGSGKSNVLGFLANRSQLWPHAPTFILIDCNRLRGESSSAFFKLLRQEAEKVISSEALGKKVKSMSDDDQLVLDAYLGEALDGGKPVCFLLDRFDALTEQSSFNVIAGNLRSLRDRFKYFVTYVVATRRPLDASTEIAELFFGNTIWLGPLREPDALWSAKRDSIRFSGVESGWDAAVLIKLYELSWGYPSLLRACCEAYADLSVVDLNAISTHPALIRRVEEFWADQPRESMLLKSNLLGQPFLDDRHHPGENGFKFNDTTLTAKEKLLLEYFVANEGVVCEKDDLIRAVWPEDVVYERGIRDDSLAQLVRRLRVKIEAEPSNPTFLQTVPGRGYIFRK